MSDFDPARYWQERLSADGGLTGVGNIGVGPRFNARAYDVRCRVFRRMAAGLPGGLSGRDVLDLGSGTGVYLEQWRRLGVRSLRGADVTRAAVRNLASRFQDLEILELDITEDLLPLEEGCADALSCMDVMFHIVDDARYRTAVKNFHRLLRPGGYLILTELLLHRPLGESYDHVKFRQLGDVVQILERQGFVIESRAPFLYLMNDPLDTQSRLIKGWWNLARRLTHRASWLDRLVSAAVVLPERLAVRWARESPSTEILVCRRP